MWFILLLSRMMQLRKLTMNSKKSFSLVELTIVVVIAGVLSMTIIVGGFKLPNYAKSIAIVNEISSYRQAINTFYNSVGGEYSETKYLPGDFPNAQYQFAPAGYQSYTYSQISSLSENEYSQMPLNGNGDGKVNAQIVCNTNVCYSEAFGVWSHLGAYGLIGKKYSNVCNLMSSMRRSTCVKADYNLPKVSNGTQNAVYTFFKPDLTYSEQRLLFGIFSDNEIFVDSHILMMSDLSIVDIYRGGIETIGTFAFGSGGALRADLMMMVDDKIDDGLPLTGSVLGINGGTVNGIKACNSYDGDGSSFRVYGKSTEKSKITYNVNTNHAYCIGVFVFPEFK